LGVRIRPGHRARGLFHLLDDMCTALAQEGSELILCGVQVLVIRTATAHRPLAARFERADDLVLQPDLGRDILRRSLLCFQRGDPVARILVVKVGFFVTHCCLASISA
jgi:hypothetical protein